MSKFWDEKLPVATQIRTMEAGECLSFPMSKLLNIRANLCSYGLTLNRRYRSHVNREDNCIEVTREA